VSRFFLTTAIDYVNSRPHLGTAYEKIAADVIARYKRLCGFDTRFLMGNDEHSQNVYRSAVDRGLDPLEYCDRMEQEFLATWQRLDVSFDDFIRTTEPRHRAGVTEMARRTYEAGDIYEGTYDGWYCVGCEAFKQEKDLVDGNCPIHLTRPEWIREKNYFFRLSKYQQPLLDHFAAHPEFLQPEPRRNEILQLLAGGLEDISVSRAGQAWGIPLPFDASSVVYVWFDALINYASAVGLGTDPTLFERWWPADLHIIGKDITRFHTVIWPAMLMSAGLPLPGQVFGHGFMTVNGQRMSKSLGTIIDPIEAADRFGADPLRLFLMKEIAFGNDGDFSWERYHERYNVDLANNLGNLVSRVSAMAQQYRGGRVSPTSVGSGRLRQVADSEGKVYRRAMEALALHEGAAAAFRLIDSANEFIAETAPWQLAKDPASADRLGQVLFDAAEAIRVAAVWLTPLMPTSAREILRRVGAPSDDLRLEPDGNWRPEGERALPAAGPLWPRFGDKSASASAAAQAKPARAVHRATKAAVAPASEAAAEHPVGAAGKDDSMTDTPLPAPEAAPAAAATAPVQAAADADRISIDDFMKVDLRVAKVLAAERVPNSRKLVKMTVDAGTEQRTIVAGIANSYEADALVGRSIVIVANLQPAKLMGIESNGMVLAASADGGGAVLVSFEQPPPPGTRVR
jgi:methionyl-tRNA synthetase